MKIGVLAWGSLQWDPRGLCIEDTFEPTGPVLPVEFSRISGSDESKPRLTLVIDETNGSRCKTYVAESSFRDLEKAKENLKLREGMHYVNGVGYIVRQSNEVGFRAKERHPNAVEAVRAWLESTDYDAAIWTALASNFSDKRDEPFAIDAALRYLEELSADNLAIALDYFSRAPEQTQTKLREAVEARWPEQRDRE